MSLVSVPGSQSTTKDYVAARAASFLGATNQQLVGAVLTPFDSPQFELVNNSGARTVKVDTVTYPGRWVADTNGDSNSVFAMLAKLGGSGSNGALVDGQDAEDWYACLNLNLVDAPDSASIAGLGWRNQTSGPIDGMLGVYGSTSSTKLVFWANTGTALQSTDNLATGTEYFLEVYRTGGTTYFLVNNTLQGSGNVRPIGTSSAHHGPTLYIEQGNTNRKRFASGMFGLFAKRSMGL